jgi:hypothetical protein
MAPRTEAILRWALRLSTSGFLLFLALQLTFVASFATSQATPPAADEAGYTMVKFAAGLCVILTGCILSCKRIALSIVTILMLTIGLIVRGDAVLRDRELTPQLIVVMALVGVYVGLLLLPPAKPQ